MVAVAVDGIKFYIEDKSIDDATGGLVYTYRMSSAARNWQNYDIKYFRQIECRFDFNDVTGWGVFQNDRFIQLR